MNLPQTHEDVCSPKHRCFPPQPTICLFCRNTTVENCPFRKKSRESNVR
jgi:hypothetical protein